MKVFLIGLSILVIFLGGFFFGVFTGANRSFPYNMMRSLSDKLRLHRPNLIVQEKVGVVLFGDSLSARGAWGEIQDSQNYELLVLAQGGLRASSFPYDPNTYSGNIHIYWLGTNDLLSGNNLVSALAGVERLAGKSAKAGKEVVILGVPVPLGLNSFRRGIFENYNRELSSLSSANGWRYLEINQILEDKYPERKKISPDGIHYTLEASEYFATVLLQFLEDS